MNGRHLENEGKRQNRFGGKELALRCLAAIPGGYVLTSLVIIALTLFLPLLGMTQAEALLASSLAGFLVYAGIVMAVFHAPSARQAWIWLAAACLACLAVMVALKMQGV